MLKLYLSLGILALCQAENLFTVSMRGNFYNDVNITEDGENWVFSTHGIPDHDHGPFPSKHNPNTVKVQDHVFKIPKTPALADTPGCLPMGSIGVALNGVPFFNPYSGEGFNAVEGDNKEIFDDCDGHPAQQGDYHYHKLPGCLYDKTEEMQLLGIALDGYPIYNDIAIGGSTLTSKDLDLCHGHEVQGVYGYVITTDFPYILGCFKGVTNERERPPPNGGDDGRPPPTEGDDPNRPPPGEGEDGRRPPPQGGMGGMGMGGCDIPCYANVSQPEGCPRNGTPPTGTEPSGTQSTKDPLDNGASQIFQYFTMLLMLMVALFQ